MPLILVALTSGGNAHRRWLGPVLVPLTALAVREIREDLRLMECLSMLTSKEGNVLADFGKKLILGLIAAACVVGVHAAMFHSVVG